MRGQLPVFCLRQSARTIYHDRTDWLQYWINLVTRVLVYFQQKRHIALSDWIEPQIVLGFSAHTCYVKCCLLCVVYYFCAGNEFDNGNPIESNKYKIGDMNQIIIVNITIL